MTHFVIEQTVVESRSKKYPVEFLLQLRDLPQCKKPVKFLSNLQHTLYEDQSNRSAVSADSISAAKFSKPCRLTMFDHETNLINS